MRILQLTPWFPSHPQDQHGNFIYDSIKALIEMGHEVTTLVTTAWKPKFASIIDKNWKVKSIQLERFQNDLRLYTCNYISIPRHYFCPVTFWNYKKVVSYNLKKIIAKNDIQLIHAQTEFCGMPAVEISSQLNIPAVVTVHGISTEKKLYTGITRKQLFEYPLRNASSVVLVGRPLFDFAKQFVRQTDHFKIIPNGFRISNENTSNEKKIWVDKLYKFVSVSNLEEGKGIDINLHALSKLNLMGKTSWTYKIIGDGSERERLEALSKNLKLEKQVFFLGAITHDEVYKQLANSHIFILPSYREAFGVAYIEAMSCGLLTIGVEGQGPQAYINHGESGFLAKPKCTESLLNIFVYIFNNPDTSLELAKAGQAYVKQNFTWQQHASQLTNLYSVLIKE